MSRIEALKKKPRVSKEDILNSTRGGLDIYKKYIPSLEKENDRYIGLCPFHSEKTGSFQVFGTNNSYKCFGCGVGGSDAVNFVMAQESKSFVEVLNMLSKDFTVRPSENSDTPTGITRKPMKIDFADKPFTDAHKAYWNKYLLPESYLRKKNVFAIDLWAINGKIQRIGRDEIVFAYLADEIDEVKILRIGPNVEKKDKWRNTVPNNYLWDFPKEKVEELWIMKARKDSFCMEYLWGKTTTALQNEDPLILLENNYDRINAIAAKKVIGMGSDDQGWHSSFLITHLTGWDYFNSPNYMLKYGCQDIADVVAEFGPDVIEQDLKRKGYL